MAARGFFVEVEQADKSKLVYPGVPYTFSEIQREAPLAAPTLGQHNNEIYCGRLGYDIHDFVKLKEAGVI
jgi:crotonobetainyl-CoA:carnitine CoA-transferase CaiB-like acyl-CoA transferase